MLKLAERMSTWVSENQGSRACANLEQPHWMLGEKEKHTLGFEPWQFRSVCYGSLSTLNDIFILLTLPQVRFLCPRSLQLTSHLVSWTDLPFLPSSCWHQRAKLRAQDPGQLAPPSGLNLFPTPVKYYDFRRNSSIWANFLYQTICVYSPLAHNQN